MPNIEQHLINLFKGWSGKVPVSVMKLPGSGSYRSYYRLQAGSETVIGAHNDDIRENDAFIAFTSHFRKQGLPVPEILATDRENRTYLITDLGDTTLYQMLVQNRAREARERVSLPQGEVDALFPREVLEVYKKAIGWLPAFQVKAGAMLDYSVCYPRAAFDRQSMMWDLNYFKYYFLKLAKVPFDEQALEDDFAGLCDLLLAADADFFLFRDFQSRNIMVLNGEPWFIDYQGGRKGALQYDVASLLTDGKANIPMGVRQELLDFYLDSLEKIYPVDRRKFLELYQGFALIRILQALGAYGFRGYYENKPHFLQSIPFALHNLKFLRANNLIGFGLNTLMSVIDLMIDNPALYSQQIVELNTAIYNKNNKLHIENNDEPAEKKLAVTIHSFSYKKVIPVDKTANGGGFVFDCRALPNPGRYEEFRKLNGKDQPVIDFLAKESAVEEFLGHVISLVDQSVTTYAGRGFDNLMVSFGCTGGQHRSVYCAEKLANHLKNKYKITVNLFHDEQENQGAATVQ
ncbi:MAG: phosphotransferase [Bacteroidetes bacterium]|nr:phosphotransferase [Bacteroidota bacterium]